MNRIQPERLGFSSQRLHRIHDVIQRTVDESRLAGVSILIARHGEPAYLDRVGLMDVDRRKPLREDTLFRIYSMTKPVTCAAALILLEEGCLNLSDPVSDYIPAFKRMWVVADPADPELNAVEQERPVTIRHLMTHTAGLTYGDDDTPLGRLYVRRVWGPLQRDPAMALETWVKAAAGMPLAFQPGTAFRYSIAHDVLGYLVQVVSGIPFDVFLKERIFDPLRMADTGFFVPAEKKERFAELYTRDEQGLRTAQSHQNLDFHNPNTMPGGGGGLVSSMNDYYRFAQMLLNKGELDGERILGRKTVELMTLNHLPPGVHPFEEAWRGYGLGVSVLQDVAASQEPGSVGNFGWSGAAGTHFWVDPVEDLLGILMVQILPGSLADPLPQQLRTLTYQALVD